VKPAVPPAFDPNDSRYWDERDLEQELERVFSICHGCRMCIGYCPSFPALFDAVDGYVTLRRGEVDALTDADYARVNDLCYQCKICYFKCPYTADDGHAFLVDFPRLMQRHKAQRARRDGVTLQDRALGEPELLGKLGGGLATPMSSFVSSSRLLRKIQEKVTGISAEFNLPPFAAQPFPKWLAKHEPAPGAGSAGEVALFSTCTVAYNLPAAGIAAVQVLEHNGLRVSYASEQTCCGMPNLDGGDVAAAQAKARRNVAALLPEVRAGRTIVVPGPTCSYTLRKEYPELLGTPEAREVAAATVDLMEFLRARLRAGTLVREFTRPLGRVAYHVACHLRAQKVGQPARQILEQVPGTEVAAIEQCSAVDGTWGMKSQHYELGRKYAAKLVRAVGDLQWSAVATDCPLSGLRLSKELGAPAVHPIELLNHAYGLPTTIPAAAMRRAYESEDGAAPTASEESTS